MTDQELESLLNDLESDRAERKESIAAVMKDLGYVQRFGMGIAMARQAMATNGNPAPEFQVEDTHVAVILRRRP